MPIPIILDCDPGTDDAFALLLALASPELEVLAVTVAGGNVGLDRTLPNALALIALAGSNVPVSPAPTARCSVPSSARPACTAPTAWAALPCRKAVNPRRASPPTRSAASCATPNSR